MSAAGEAQVDKDHKPVQSELSHTEPTSAKANGSQEGAADSTMADKSDQQPEAPQDTTPNLTPVDKSDQQPEAPQESTTNLASADKPLERPEAPKNAHTNSTTANTKPASTTLIIVRAKTPKGYKGYLMDLDLLSHHSTVFRESYDECASKGAYDLRHWEDSAAIFDRFKLWLTTKSIIDVARGETQDSLDFDLLFNMHIWVQFYGVPKLEDDVVNIILQKCEQSATFPASLIPWVYQNTKPMGKDSPLTNMVISLCQSLPELDALYKSEFADRLPRQFLWDLCLATHEDSKSEHPSFPIFAKSVHPCNFHTHSCGYDEDCLTDKENPFLARLNKDGSSTGPGWPLAGLSEELDKMGPIAMV